MTRRYFDMTPSERSCYAACMVNLSNAWMERWDSSALVERARQNACRLVPHNPEPHSLLASAYALQKKHILAETHFKIASRLQPWDPIPHLNYAYWLDEQGRDYEAAQYLKKASRVSKKMRDEALRELGLVYVEMGETEKGLKLLKGSAERLGSDDVQTDVAVAHLMAGDAERARDILVELVSRHPEDWHIREYFARALEGTGEFQKAEAEYMWLIENGPDPAVIWALRNRRR